MEYITDSILIFLLVFIISYFGILNFAVINPLQQKLIIFIAVSSFMMILSLIRALVHNHDVRLLNMIGTSLFVGLIAFIGYTIASDLQSTPATKILWTAYTANIPNDAAVAIVVVSTILVARVVGYVFNIDAGYTC